MALDFAQKYHKRKDDGVTPISPASSSTCRRSPTQVPFCIYWFADSKLPFLIVIPFKEASRVERRLTFLDSFPPTPPPHPQTTGPWPAHFSSPECSKGYSSKAFSPLSAAAPLSSSTAAPGALDSYLLIISPTLVGPSDPTLAPTATMNDAAGAADCCGRANPAAATEGGKAVGCPYSAMVAHRALFGSHRRRVGARKVGAGDGKSNPSRLSKVSAADDGK
ncbi:hypothetical protein GW17_00018422 [Ensete ventricosum]|nr:hypothetical protein GW17_00018422 [Ensete ventricosum]